MMRFPTGDSPTLPAAANPHAGAGRRLHADGLRVNRVVNEWRNPDYGSPRFNKILVTGVSRQPSIRRRFEDEFVAKLKAAGVDAEPSYRYIPEDGQVDEARVKEAVWRANADAAIITRLVRVEKKTEVSPGFYEPAPAVTFGF